MCVVPVVVSDEEDCDPRLRPAIVARGKTLAQIVLHSHATVEVNERRAESELVKENTQFFIADFFVKNELKRTKIKREPKLRKFHTFGLGQ